MSHVDEKFAAQLRELAGSSQPPMRLEPQSVVRGGRVRRWRRNAARSVGAVAVVGALALGAAQLLQVEPPETPPATQSQDPRPLGEGQTAELAPGVIAANRPEPIEVAGIEALDLGFTTRFVQTVGEQPTSAMPTVLVPIEQTTFEWDTEPLSGPRGSGVTLSNVLDGELYSGMETHWLDDESPERFATNPEGRGSLVSHIGMPIWSFEQVLLGSVPSWLDEPRVVVFSERGFDLADGDFAYRLEVPTFRSPTSDGRLVFALKITEEQGEYRGDDADPLVDVVIHRGADGAVFVGDQCGPDGVQSCAERFGGPFLDAAGLLRTSTDPGDVAVHSEHLRPIAGGDTSRGWHIGGGRWVPQSVVADVVVGNHFTSETPEAIEGGPDWESFVFGIDGETGEELWRWEIGEGAHPDCGPAHEDTGYDAATLECWWYPDDDADEYRHSFHDPRTGAQLAEEQRPAIESTGWPHLGGFSDHVAVGGLIVGPESSDAIAAVDPATGELVWRYDDASQVVGTDGSLVYVSSIEDGRAVIVGLDLRDGTEASRVTVGSHVIDVTPIGPYLFAIHGTDYSAFELGLSRIR